MKHIFLLVIFFISLASIATEGDKKETPVDKYRAVVKSKNKKVYSKAALKLRQWMIKNDLYTGFGKAIRDKAPGISR